MDLNNAEVAVTTQHILDGKEYKDVLCGYGNFGIV